MTTKTGPNTPPTVVELEGGIASDLVEYGQTKIAAVLARAGRPVPYSRLRVVRHHDPARRHPVLASVAVDLNGRPVHVHVDASGPREAVDLLVDRLAHRLERTARGRGRHRRGPRVHERRGRSADALDGPVHRAVTPHADGASLDDAVGHLEDLGLRFHLFLEAGRGMDSVLYRSGPTGLRLSQVDGRADLVRPGRTDVTTSAVPAPLLSTAQATERLQLVGDPFVFYREESGRAAVLYRIGDSDVGVVGFPPADR